MGQARGHNGKAKLKQNRRTQWTVGAHKDASCTTESPWHERVPWNRRQDQLSDRHGKGALHPTETETLASVRVSKSQLEQQSRSLKTSSEPS